MKIRFLPFLVAVGLLSVTDSNAQDKEVSVDTFGNEVRVIAPRTFYFGGDFDGAIFSTSVLKSPNSNDGLTPLRFSYFLNIGFNYNYDISNNFGVFTGLGIKNIGFIEKIRSRDSTVKRRVYALGVPLGVKLGNLDKRNFFFLGGGVSFAFNYREKGFIRRGDKVKFNEWFSDRTPLFMPNVFIGGSINPGIVAKLQYYPGNFLNPDFTETVNGDVEHPYAGYDVHLLLLSIGIDIHYSRKTKETWHKIK